MTYKTTYLIDGVTYYETCVNGNITYTKVVDGKEVSLDEKDKYILNRYLETYLSNVMIDYYLTYNKGINDERFKRMLKPALTKLEQIVPKEYKQPFYTNIKTLKFNIIDDLRLPNAIAEYDRVDNTIFVRKSYFEKLLNQEGLDYSYDVFEMCLLHELLHCASSDKKLYAGFIAYDSDIQYKGLNEGYTQLLTAIYYPEELFASNYAVMSLLMFQLMEIVGKDTLDSCYFKKHNVKGIIDKLCEIIPNPSLAENILNLIEMNYIYENSNKKSSYLREIENLMTIYFNRKVAQEREQNVNEDIIKKQRYRYYTALITQDKLDYFGIDYSHYLDLEKVESDFHYWEDYLNPVKVAR